MPARSVWLAGVLITFGVWAAAGAAEPSHEGASLAAGIAAPVVPEARP